jgi:hypothetical protein
MSNEEKIIRPGTTQWKQNEARQEFKNQLNADLTKYLAFAKANDFTTIYNDERDMGVISVNVATAKRLNQTEYAAIVTELLDLLKRNWTRSQYEFLDQRIQDELSDWIKKEKQELGYASDVKITPSLTPFFQTKEEIILWYNEHHFAAVINELTRVGWDPSYKFQKKSDFFDLYAGSLFNTGTTDKPKYECSAKIWFNERRRRTYKEGIVFDPLRKYERDEETLNMWPDFAIKPVKGSAAFYEDHILEVSANGDEEHAKWILAWFAHKYQFPWKKIMSALVFRHDREGTGKSWPIRKLGYLMDGDLARHKRLYFKTSKWSDIVHTFNIDLETALIIHFEEADRAENINPSDINEFITGDLINVEAKYLPRRQVKSYSDLIITGNAKWIVPASRSARRYGIFDGSNKYEQRNDHFSKLDEAWYNGGAQSVMWMLKNYDTTKFDLRNPPKTAALLNQKDYNLKYEARFWLDILRREQLPYARVTYGRYYGSMFTDEKPMVEFHVLTAKLFEDFVSYTKNSVARSRSDETNFGIEMREFFPKNGVIEYGTGRGSGRMLSFLKKDRIGGAYYYIIPSLGICRWLFDVITGQEHDWALWSEDPNWKDKHWMPSSLSVDGIQTQNDAEEMDARTREFVENVIRMDKFRK